MACRIPAKKSCNSHLFSCGPKPFCSDGLCAGVIESHIFFFVLRPILVKLHIRTRLIESFRITFRLWWCAEEKLHFAPVHTLCQLKRDKGLFPPLGRVVEFRARYRQIPGRRFLGVGKIWKPSDSRSRSYKHLYTHWHTDTLTHWHTHTRQLIYMASRTRIIPRTIKVFWKVY